MIRTKVFDSFILLLIVASTVTLALDEPLSDPDSKMNMILYYLDLGFTLVFSIECILKMIALGFVMNGPKSYLKSPWNVLDFLIVLLSFISLILTKRLRIIKSLRLMRILRPLRMISKNEDLRIAVLCLINSIKDIMNVFVVAIFSFSVYAIFGVNFFKGQFFYCHTEHLPLYTQDELSTDQSYSKWHCLSMGGEWISDRANFNNVFYAALTLFQMATTEGWTNVMYNGIDATKIDYTYKKDNQIAASLYFIFFILLGSLFIMNMFVGVVINTFKFEKEKIGLNYLLTDT